MNETFPSFPSKCQTTFPVTKNSQQMTFQGHIEYASYMSKYHHTSPFMFINISYRLFWISLSGSRVNHVLLNRSRSAARWEYCWYLGQVLFVMVQYLPCSSPFSILPFSSLYCVVLSLPVSLSSARFRSHFLSAEQMLIFAIWTN